MTFKFVQCYITCSDNIYILSSGYCTELVYNETVWWHYRVWVHVINKLKLNDMYAVHSSCTVKCKQVIYMHAHMQHTCVSLIRRYTLHTATLSA